MSAAAFAGARPTFSVRAQLQPEPDSTETIRWVSVKTAFPDADTAVLMCNFGGSEPVWLGSTDGKTWRDAEGFEVAMPTHWAELPMGVPS